MLLFVVWLYIVVVFVVFFLLNVLVFFDYFLDFVVVLYIVFFLKFLNGEWLYYYWFLSVFEFLFEDMVDVFLKLLVIYNELNLS